MSASDVPAVAEPTTPAAPPSVRERLIHATADLVRRNGVAGTGITEIVEHSGVARRSVYTNFPGGKAALVHAATRASGDATTQVLHSVLEQDDPVGSFTELWGALLTSSDFQGGCVVAAAATGRRDAPEAAQAAGEIYAEWTGALRDRLVHREGLDDDKARELASVILSAVEGALIVARARQDLQPLDDVRKAFAWVFDEA